MTTEQHNDAPEAPNEATAASTAQQTALPKPDRPGKYRVTWSNGEKQEVIVVASGETLFYREANRKYNPDYAPYYRVNDGWLGRWEAL